MRLTYWTRQAHRYLGLFIGLQFLLWTLGGLYFSWTRLEDIHGEHLLKPRRSVPAHASLASPSLALQQLAEREPVESIAGLGLIDILGQPTYQIHYLNREGIRRTCLADAVTGQLRPELSREEAVQLATAAFAPGGPVRAVEQLTAANVGQHHEYRGGPLPAWAISFEHPDSPMVYVAAEQGEVRTVRHQRWRLFDFLWMLHTMDYQGRDDFNNLVLRVFSVLGLVTLLSGFLLFALTSRLLRGR